MNTTKSAQLNNTNLSALEGAISPAGISRKAVRGFWASKERSRYRLKAMAALRAVIIQPRTNKNKTPIFFSETVPLLLIAAHPRVKPMIAKGRAKIV